MPTRTPVVMTPTETTRTTTPTLDQDVEVEGDDVDLTDVVLSNNGSATSDSDGSADIDTGDADAIGNYSATGVALAAWTASALDLVDQSIEITNDGDADANSGDNDVVGNNSENEAENEQETELDADDLDVADLVLSNSAETANSSDGSGSARTGNASAQGNVAVNSACSGLNTEVDCPEVSLPPLPPPSCPCKKKAEEVTPPIVTPVPVEVPAAEQLPVTGGSSCSPGRAWALARRSRPHAAATEPDGSVSTAVIPSGRLETAGSFGTRPFRVPAPSPEGLATRER